MSATILTFGVVTAQILLGAAMLCMLVRLIRGPRAQDRVLALDAIYVVMLLLLVTLGIQTRTAVFFEAALIVAVLGFVATVALAKFLMRGEVIE
ncbi:K+/H+ antiporter subunit F [Falsirhodobacter algicola]|uniref:K+/H+ antiporter subunit F n=1 Tax=Falsirhodobacter algicola TaxID=2692330 RepID=A0A8J8SKF9_9RHOB|nr:K+/H+ antiporter subunit F [Falsirhodobacter algicola]QUS35338.1 K+/H+ antiporter subunit F [Falsirhodobacter algicola]